MNKGCEKKTYRGPRPKSEAYVVFQNFSLH